MKVIISRNVGQCPVFSLEKMRKDHIPEVVNLFLSSFSGDYPSSYSEDFFINMGKKYLTIFFKEFCEYDFNFGVVAVHKTSNQVIGFSTASANMKKQYEYFYSKHFFIIALIFLYKVLTNSVIRKGVKEKIGSIKRAINSFITRQPKPEARFPKLNSAYLMFIAVDKRFQRAGIARAILDFLTEEAKKARITHVQAFVNSGNIQGIIFFEKCGWKIINRTINGIIYSVDVGKL